MTLTHLGPSSLGAAFSSIAVHIYGISVLQGGNLIPSRHIILDENLEIDLAAIGEATEAVVQVVLPNEVGCRCRATTTTLPASATVRLGGALASSAAEGSGCMVGYRLEVTAKRRGWGKATEKCISSRLGGEVIADEEMSRITAAFPVGAVHPFGVGTPHLPSRQAALAALDELADGGWKVTDTSFLYLGSTLSHSSESDDATSRRFGAQNYPSVLSLAPSLNPQALSAELAYSSWILPDAVLVAWRIVLRVSQREADSLLRLLKSDALDVSIGRRIVPIFSDKRGGG